ncbi:MAG TPA: DUF4345 domain-containing protein [Saprospiraceae bacterium]|nr:DUF4345 domain-containing protein [Saprospiraceae bacterium]HMP24234.1 DUF4345 domain-containing protein [Saprospiraceae bacterium]
MKTSRILLVLGSLVYLGFGFLFFINPDAITDMDGIVLPTRSSANHIRAILGGMEIGLGVLLIYFSMRKERIIYGLIVLSGSIGAASIARLYGIIFDGAGDTSNWISFMAEFSFGALALVLYFIEKRGGKL